MSLRVVANNNKTHALSSAEAETYGMVAPSAEVIGIQSCACDFGRGRHGTIYTDASAALYIVQTVRHILTQRRMQTYRHTPHTHSPYTNHTQ